MGFVNGVGFVGARFVVGFGLVRRVLLVVGYRFVLDVRFVLGVRFVLDVGFVVRFRSVVSSGRVGGVRFVFDVGFVVGVRFAIRLVDRLRFDRRRQRVDLLGFTLVRVVDRFGSVKLLGLVDLLRLVQGVHLIGGRRGRFLGARRRGVRFLRGVEVPLE